jgi:hypothetical protein
MKPEPPPPESSSSRPKLEDLSQALTKLHKALIDSERIGYESSFGKIETPGEFLQLLMNDPWFAWLHPVSQLIAAVDEAIDSKEPVSPEQADAFFQRARTLLAPSETGEGFGRHYFDAMQRDPEVVLSHASISRLWKPQKPPAPDAA